MPTPWNENTRLLKVGLRGYDVEREKLPPSNLVFLIDVSGSMQSNDKLSLLARSLELLTTKMRGDDRIAIVTYAGASGVVLESTKGNEQSRIKRAIRSLTAGGSTNGAAGISLAYDIARENFIADGINRVILATDGDFNVGVVDFSALIDMVEKRRQSGISLTALGFGTGNLNDHLMEQLADKGNGNYAYIDTLNEANKVLIDEMSATLLTIASDVKIQIEFNPALVSEYRLVGYENRALSREDFNNDKIDAGEIGAGHTVTALYEIALTGSGGERIEPLRYGKKLQTPMPENNNGNTQDDQSSLEVAHLRLRYKKPGESVSSRVEKSILMSDAHPSIAELNDDARFAVSVAAFGQYLRGGDYLGNFGISEIRALAKDSRGADNHGYRAEFLRLLSLAENLLPPEQPVKVSTIDDSGR